MSGKDKLSVLASLSAAYQKTPLPELLYVAAIVLWRDLDQVSQDFSVVVLPSEILYRLAEGLQSGQRYLSRWVRRFAVRRMKRYRLQQETETLVADILLPRTHQAPSDPGLRRAISVAIGALTPLQQQTILHLLKHRGITKIAQLTGCPLNTAKKRVADARGAFRATLKNIFSEDEQRLVPDLF